MLIIKTVNMPFIVMMLFLGFARSLPKRMSNPVAMVIGITMNRHVSAIYRNAISNNRSHHG